MQLYPTPCFSTLTLLPLLLKRQNCLISISTRSAESPEKSGNGLGNIFRVDFNRPQLTIADQVSYRLATSGVPQGSILGPILYLNDLLSSVPHCSEILNFADDTKCLKQIREVEDTDLFQEDLHRIGNWSLVWKMLFNISKFALVQFTTSKKKIDSTYSMNGTLISSCRSHKDLGIILSSDLSWSDHYMYILAKAYRKSSA